MQRKTHRPVQFEITEQTEMRTVDFDPEVPHGALELRVPLETAEQTEV